MSAEKTTRGGDFSLRVILCIHVVIFKQVQKNKAAFNISRIDDDVVEEEENGEILQ